MSYFIEIPNYQTYSGKEADFHFSYNANSGGGQSFLGGKFINVDGELTSPTVLDEYIGVFIIESHNENGQDLSYLLNDNKGKYKIKPRGNGSNSMKLEIGNQKTAPSKLISSFFMLPSTCTVKSTSNLKVSILTTNNYWLHSMWLECAHQDIAKKEVHLKPIDFIFSGGKTKDNKGTERYFKLDFVNRVKDILNLINNIDSLPIEIGKDLEIFASIYKNESVFDYEKCEAATKNIMVFLAQKYPNEYSGIEDPLPFLIKLKKSTVYTSTGDNDKAIQVIYYGAPGTGKSYAVNEVTKQYPETIRTTFHPDSDYSTFVGAYKPSTTTVARYGLNGKDTVALRYPDGDFKDDPITESKIEYKFVKQAFLKAYIKAWKNYIKAWKNFKNSSGLMVHSLTNGPKESWLLTSLEGDEIKYTKTEIISIEEYMKLVKGYWDKEMNKAKPEIGTHNHYGATACFWYKKQNPSTLTAEACWEAVLTELKNNSVIIGTPSSQTYRVSLEKGDIVVRSESTAKKETINNKDKETGSVQSAISKIINDYQLQNFDEGWRRLKNEIEKAKSPKSVPQYLVIEEINRGNCAQVFGDLFQLLDRKNGFSSYPIEADEDIRKALLEENPEDGLSFGKDGLSLSQEQRDYINQHYYQGDDVATKIQKGQVLVLPPNLYIWATMNTSDQSLFPIDSAFKRRWDWVYVPIQYEEEFMLDGKNKINRSYHFVIKIDENNQYRWIEFIKEVNKKICDLTGSEDKQIGNYFVDLPNGETEIDEKTFKNKVMFYLWNDICKDEFGIGNQKNFYRTKDEEFSFNRLFEANGQQQLIKFLDNIEGIKITTSTTAGNTPPTSTPSDNTPNESD